MIVLLRGNDLVGVRRRLQQLRDEADGGTGMLVTNLTVLEGRVARPEEILGPVMTPPFLAPRRMVLVEGFLDRFARREAKANEPLTDGASDHEDEATADAPVAIKPDEPRGLPAFEPLIDVITAGNLPESTLLIFTGAGTGKNAFAEKIAAAPGVSDEVLQSPTKDALLRYIRDEGALRGLRFRSGGRAPASDVPYGQGDPVALLAEITQGDTMRIVNELDKLALYAMGKEATAEMVGRICSGERESNVFKFGDALMDGKTADALLRLEELRAGSDSSQGLIGLLAQRYRQLAVVAELVELRAPDEEIGKAMGAAGKYEGLRKAAVNRARRIGSSGARDAMAAVVETDRRIKLGELDDEVAMELLVLRLAELAAS